MARKKTTMGGLWLRFLLAKTIQNSDAKSGFRAYDAAPAGAQNRARIALECSDDRRAVAAPMPSNSPQERVADSSCRNAVNFSSARTTKRFPSSRCASATQIVRPSESNAETQPKTPTGFAEVVVDDFPVLHAADSRLLFLAEFLESGIGAQGVPERIEPKKGWRNRR
jgi:hypothetical protein